LFDVNPYFFAMLIALNLQTSFLTPPMAMSAYYLKGVQSKNVELMEIFAGIMPFLRNSNFCNGFNVLVPWNSFMVTRNTFR
jgi:TRAP-type mannitol/chloroaromatic compound transport system permease large subunit